MARPKSLVPAYRRHKASGQAVAYVGRKVIYLGRHGSPESKQKYSELLTRLASEPAAVRDQVKQSVEVLSVAELVLKYATSTDGLPRFSRSEQYCQKTVLRLLADLFGEIAVNEFGPLKLRVLREAMIAGDPDAKNEQGEPAPRAPWSRKTVNRQVKRLRAVFRWGVSLELVPIENVHALDTLRSLRIGETAAAESIPRRAVSQQDIDAVRAVLRPHHRDIFDLLLLTGARPGEIFGLTVGMVDRETNKSAGVWRADQVDHKTRMHGKPRTLFFNLEAQAILAPRLEGRRSEARVFPLRRDNFGAVIRRACRRANVAPFVPHGLRHTAGTRVADEAGMESAQRLLGHSTVAMAEHYARAAEAKAIAAVKRLNVGDGIGVANS